MREVFHSVFIEENILVCIHGKGLKEVCLFEDKTIMLFSKNLEVGVGGGKHQELRKKSVFKSDAVIEEHGLYLSSTPEVGEKLVLMGELDGSDRGGIELSLFGSSHLPLGWSSSPLNPHLVDLWRPR